MKHVAFQTPRSGAGLQRRTPAAPIGSTGANTDTRANISQPEAPESVERPYVSLSLEQLRQRFGAGLHPAQEFEPDSQSGRAWFFGDIKPFDTNTVPAYHFTLSIALTNALDGSETPSSILDMVKSGDLQIMWDPTGEPNRFLIGKPGSTTSTPSAAPITF